MKKLLLTGLLVLISASCAMNLPTNKRSLVLEQDSRGGLCQNGGCYSYTKVYSDGFYEIKNNISSKTGSVNIELVSNLQKQIQSADFKKLSSVPFTGTCPTAYDGSENKYTFYNSSGDSYVLDSCKVKIDEPSPLFKAVSNIFDNIR